MVKENPEVVTKSEAARRWGVSPPAVAKYAAKGLPVRPDGKLDWSTADAWRRGYNVPEHSGSHKARKRAREAEPITLADQQSQEFADGAAWMALQLCTSARTTLPAFVSSAAMDSIPAEARPAHKALFAGLFIHMIESWTRGYVEAGSLPPIDWGCFGADAAAVSREFDELRKDWTK
jgi:hypothetical protein